MNDFEHLFAMSRIMDLYVNKAHSQPCHVNYTWEGIHHVAIPIWIAYAIHSNDPMEVS